jgi:hypothetical protein
MSVLSAAYIRSMTEVLRKEVPGSWELLTCSEGGEPKVAPMQAALGVQQPQGWIL